MEAPLPLQKRQLEKAYLHKAKQNDHNAADARKQCFMPGKKRPDRRKRKPEQEKRE